MGHYYLISNINFQNLLVCFQNYIPEYTTEVGAQEVRVQEKSLATESTVCHNYLGILAHEWILSGVND